MMTAVVDRAAITIGAPVPMAIINDLATTT